MSGAEAIITETTDVQVSTEDDATTDAEVTETTDAAETEQDDQPDPLEVDKERRREARSLRDRLKASEARAEELGRRLHAELTRSSGKLADATDLPYDAAHLDDADTHTAAIDSLLAAKPHLRSRVPVGGNVGQGAKDSEKPPVGLLSTLKSLV